MADILRARHSWRRQQDPNSAVRASDLTEDEQQHVRRALHFLMKRLGGRTALAKAMRTKLTTVASSLKPQRGVSAGTALRAARAAGRPVEELLAGAYPPPGACPYCGRCD